MMERIEWPADLAGAVKVSISLEGGSNGGQVGLDGRTQVIARENRAWIGSITLPAMPANKAARLEALFDQFKGMAVAFNLPLANYGTITSRDGEDEFFEALGYSPEEIAADQEFFDDGEPFDDGFGFDLAQPGDPVVSVAAAAGSSSIYLQGGYGATLGMGGLFSIDGFLHRVVSNQSGHVTFNPPLRRAVAVGAVVNVDAPYITARLADGKSGRVDVNFGAWSSATGFSFREAFGR